MQKRIRGLDTDFVKRGWPILNIGVGLNCGEMNVGDMGSRFRRAYTVMGDAVNIASRLEGLTKEYGVGILVSENMVKAAQGFVYREIDKVVVKGRQEGISIFEPIGKVGEVGDTQLQEIDRFHKALELYRKQRWDDAQAALKTCSTPRPTTSSTSSTSSASSTSAATRREPRGTACGSSRPSSPSLRGAHPPTRRGAEGRRGRVVDPHAAALRARPHQPVAPRGRRRLDARRHRLRRRGDVVAMGAAFRGRDGRAAGEERGRHALPSRPPGQRRMAGAQDRRALLDDDGGIPLGARGARRHRGLRSRHRHRFLRAQRARRLAHAREDAHRQRLPPRRARNSAPLPAHDARRQALASAGATGK